MKKGIFRGLALIVVVAGLYLMTRHHGVPPGSGAQAPVNILWLPTFLFLT